MVVQAQLAIGISRDFADHKCQLVLDRDPRIGMLVEVQSTRHNETHIPPTLIVGDSGGTADGIAIIVRNKDIRSKFFCDIASSLSI